MSGSLKRAMLQSEAQPAFTVFWVLRLRSPKARPQDSQGICIYTDIYIYIHIYDDCADHDLLHASSHMQRRPTLQSQTAVVRRKWLLNFTNYDDSGLGSLNLLRGMAWRTLGSDL